MLLKIVILTLTTIWLFSTGGFGGYTDPPMLQKYLAEIVKKNFIGRLFNMTSDIMKDVDIKHRIAERYIDMHKGTWDFEIGLLAGALYSNFRKMLKIYRKYSNMSMLEVYDVNEYRVFDRSRMKEYIIHFQEIHGEYNEIVYHSRVFFDLLDNHEETERKFKEKRKILGGRRFLRERVIGHSNLDKVIKSRPPGDIYTDYFGHALDKHEEKNKKQMNTMDDHLEEYFDKQYDILMKQPDIETVKTQPKRSGSEKPRVRPKKLNKQENQEKIKEPFEFIDILSMENIERELELHLNKKDRKGLRKSIQEFKNMEAKSDAEYKKNMRLRTFEKQRANFDPEKEGINIELDDML